MVNTLKEECHQGTRDSRFAPMKRANATIALYAWIFSGAIMISAHGWHAFFTIQAFVFFTVGAISSIYVFGYLNFLCQRGFAILLQYILLSVMGRPTDAGVRFINGFGIGLLSGAAAISWVMARYTTNIMFGITVS